MRWITLTLSPADLERIQDIRYEQSRRYTDGYNVPIARDVERLRGDVDFLLHLLDDALLDYDKDVTLVIGSAEWKKVNGIR